MIAPGGITSFWIGAGQLYSTAVQEAIDQYSGLSAKDLAFINTIITLEGSNYDTYDEFWGFNLGSNVEANGLIGFKGTVGVNTNGTFDIGGILFNGTNQFFNTTRSSGLQNNVDVSCFVKSNLDSGNNKSLFGNIAGNRIMIKQQPTNTRIQLRVNSTAASVFTTGTNLFLNETMYGVRRIAANQTAEVNGIEVDDTAVTSTGTTSFPIFLGAENNAGAGANFINAKVSTFKIGAGIGFNPVLHNTNVRIALAAYGSI